MKNYKKEYEDLFEVLDYFIGNLREEAKEERKEGGENKIALSGQLDNIANELEEAVYEGYPRCEGCGKILKREDQVFSYNNEEETYCKDCFNNELEYRLEKETGHPSLTDAQRNRLNRGV